MLPSNTLGPERVPLQSTWTAFKQDMIPTGFQAYGPHMWRPHVCMESPRAVNERMSEERKQAFLCSVLAATELAQSLTV